MISVNQGIGTSVPEKVEKRWIHDVSYQGGWGPLNVGVGVGTIEDTMLLRIAKGACGWCGV